jgi:hypothetical protein
MKSIMRGLFPYIAGVALALGLAGAAHKTLPVSNMPICLARVERSSGAAGELDRDFLTWTPVISSTPNNWAIRMSYRRRSATPALNPDLSQLQARELFSPGKEN